MSIKFLHALPLLSVAFFLAAASCKSEPSATRVYERVYVPSPPDYSDPQMWRISLNDSDGLGADVFYIPSTWEFDWTTEDGAVCHFADPSRTDHRADMAIEMDGVAEYMADGNNFYSPFYRHITLDSWATQRRHYIPPIPRCGLSGRQGGIRLFYE